jgi:2-dehydro-3-deoxyphosphogluconate aldolase/(4S)-4-hydroxy-2-oxoglutarate aldolase
MRDSLPFDRPAIPVAIREGRIVAIARRLERTAVGPVAEALVAGGVRAFELTVDSPAAIEVIAELAGRIDPDRLCIGAGTVLDIEAADAAIAAGARFLVSPHTDAELVAWAATRGVPCFPGAFTPTEILSAWRAGAAGVKLFPASAVGPGFVREARGPLPFVPLIPTGGISLETAPAYIASGAIAIGIGSWLTGNPDPALVRARATALAAAVGRVADASPQAVGR